MRSSIDNTVRRAIEDLFPEHTVPDEENFISKHRQHKAPDHAIFGEKLFIERKSINPGDSDAISKLNKIAQKQGHSGFGAVGYFNVAQILRQMPDPNAANQEFSDYFLNRTTKIVRSATSKFAEFFAVKGFQAPALLVISDHADLASNTAIFEFHLGRLMSENRLPNIGLLSGILYVRYPTQTMKRKDASWCRMLLRESLPTPTRNAVGNVMLTIANAVGEGFEGDEKEALNYPWTMRVLSV